MTLSHSAVESLFRLGRFEEIASDCASNLGSVHKLASADHQLVVAESMARTGRLDSARAIARSILRHPEHVGGHAGAELLPR